MSKHSLKRASVYKNTTMLLCLENLSRLPAPPPMASKVLLQIDDSGNSLHIFCKDEGQPLLLQERERSLEVNQPLPHNAGENEAGQEQRVGPTLIVVRLQREREQGERGREWSRGEGRGGATHESDVPSHCGHKQRREQGDQSIVEQYLTLGHLQQQTEAHQMD